MPVIWKFEIELRHETRRHLQYLGGCFHAAHQLRLRGCVKLLPQRKYSWPRKWPILCLFMEPRGKQRAANFIEFPWRSYGVPLIKLDQVIYEDQRRKILSEAENLRFCKINRILLVIFSSGLLSRTFGNIVYLFAVNKSNWMTEREWWTLVEIDCHAKVFWQRSCLLVFIF